MADSAQFKTNLDAWVGKALKKENVDRYDAEVIGQSEKSDGYLGDIVFVNVKTHLKCGTKKTFHLVLKLGKTNEHLRNSMPVTQVYGREIYMYEFVFPYFERFQKEKTGLGLDYIPKCYATVANVGTEVLVFENLKKCGYELHNQRQPMNLEHMKLVLRTYGRWHALSFALRDQRRDEFDELLLSGHTTNMMMEFMKHDDTAKSFIDSVDGFKNMLEDEGENDLLRRLNKVVQYGVQKHMEMLDENNGDEVVLTHGDCWNNNFMFKYGENGKKVPEKMVLLDWQLASLRSPVFDLSYFIYIVSTKKELEFFDEMMEVYHCSLSEHLRLLGSDPEVLFPFSTLMDHWRKYSAYGLLMVPMILQFVLCEAEDAPSFNDISGDQNIADVFKSIQIKDKEQYYNRIKDVTEHYVSFQNIL